MYYKQIPDLRNNSVLNMESATGQNTPAKSPRVRVVVLLVISGPKASFLLKLRLSAQTSLSKEAFELELGRSGELSSSVTAFMFSPCTSPLIEYDCDITLWPWGFK